MVHDIQGKPIMSKMFPFITKTWNPLGGKCLHKCVYCWADRLTKQYDMSKYRGPFKIYTKVLKRKFKENDFVFVQDMSDLFANTVPHSMIRLVLDRIKMFPKTKFLLLTKNPIRYHNFHIPSNCVCGATIETDSEELTKDISNAPSVKERIYWMIQLRHKDKMLSIEPILNFGLYSFFTDIKLINPQFVAIGYDNYKNNLLEPSLIHTTMLINLLEKEGIKVYRKTLREPKGDSS